MTVQATFAATLVDEWVRAGVTDAVVAPGSRSTPLTLALAAAPGIRVHVHLDERSAGFYALGLGLASGRPAVVVTTSGTAAAELVPAVIEAHHARVPLLVCTADRPPELHGVGAPQTVAQRDLFIGVLQWRGDLGPPEAIPCPAWRSLAARAAAEASAGPVQLNLAFRDPLVGEPDSLPPGRAGGRPWHLRTRRAGAVGVDTRRWAGRRGVIVAGAGCGHPGDLLAAAEAVGWPVLAAGQSGCRGDHPASVAAFDAILRAESPPADVVVRFGAPPASQALAAWLAGMGAEQVLVDPDGQWRDPERAADHVLVADPSAVGAALAAVLPAPAAWTQWWQDAEAAAQEAIDSVLDGRTEPTEPGVARTLTAQLGRDSTLFVSSSMPVRDVEWYGTPTSAARVLANRGANGIDGIVSTALGVAAVAAPTVALLGDLAFLHDSGGLLGASRRGTQLVFVVIDNNGGGIFSFLPQADQLPRREFERLFATPHDVDLIALANAYGVPGERIECAADVAPAVAGAIASRGVRVVVVPTDRDANRDVHEELTQAVVKSLAGSRPLP